MELTDKQKAHEAIADRLFEQNKFREASEIYSKCYRPYRGFGHMSRIAKKQTVSMREAWRLER